MRSLMLKFLTTSIIVLSSVSLWASGNDDNYDPKVVKFLQQAIAPNENYTFDKVVIIKKEALKDIAGWMVYFVRIDLKLPNNKGKRFLSMI